MTDAVTSPLPSNEETSPEKLIELLTSDVNSGFSLPIPTSAAYKVPDLILAPFGIASQTTIDEHGAITEKDGLAHDQTFQLGSASHSTRASE
jgi:hypothetical protein